MSSTVLNASERRTFLPLGASNWWRRAAWILALAVAGTAIAARERIAFDEDARTAGMVGDNYPGLVRARDVTAVALPTPLTIKTVMVQIGDRVAAGQVLLQLDDAEARLAVAQLQFERDRARASANHLEESLASIDRSLTGLTAAVAEANAQLAIAQRESEAVPVRQWKDSPERAQAAYEQAAARARRLAALARDGLVAPQDVEDAQAGLRVASDDVANAQRAAQAAQKVGALQAQQSRAQTKLAIAEQRRQRIDRQGELIQARLRLEQTDAALAQASARLADSTVRATHDAVVADVSVRPGDRVLAGATLLKLATLDPMVVDVDVPPAIVNRLKRGTPATIRVAAASGSITGRIRTIAPLPGDGGAHALEVEFANPAGTLLAGRSATVRFSEEN
jgi:membrane fusion protein (multidrug efflux system)